MKQVRLGSHIKVQVNGKEEFLTVDSSRGDIILHKKGKIISRRKYNGESFTYNNENYIIKMY